MGEQALVQLAGEYRLDIATVSGLILLKSPIYDGETSCSWLLVNDCFEC